MPASYTAENFGRIPGIKTMMNDSPPQKKMAYISVGSNMGDRLSNCQKGITGLTDSGIATLLAQSEFYMTEPVDYQDQDWFVNAVIKIETSLDPPELLKSLKSIEQDAGRQDGGVRFGPRVLDMDIILYDDIILSTPGLAVPHPRMHQRRFVLEPLCDIDPKMIHPILKKDMRYLADQLDENEQRIRLYP